MAQRDRNRENASERIARKVFERKQVNECNTRTIRNSLPLYISTDILLYGAKIAELYEEGSTGMCKLYIYIGHTQSGTRLTKDRKQALINEARRRNVPVEFEPHI